MRYFLYVPDGSVGLLSLEGKPQTESINSSLATFVEFLHHLRLRQEAILSTADSDAGHHHEQLRAALQELDHSAFRSPGSWWSMVMDNLANRDILAEARALLDQRRVETAEN